MRYPNVKKIRRYARTGLERRYTSIWKISRVRHNMKKYEDGNEVLPMLVYEDEVKQRKKEKRDKLSKKDLSKSSYYSDIIPIARRWDIIRSKRPTIQDVRTRPIDKSISGSSNRFSRKSNIYKNYESPIDKISIWVNCVARLNRMEIREAKTLLKERGNR